jgi:ubiquinone biosynthesis protein
VSAVETDEWGCFIRESAWVLPQEPSWERTGVEARVLAAETAAEWCRPRRVPPWRVVSVAGRLGFAVARGVLTRRERRGEAVAVSVVAAFERLGPAFVKLAQIVSAGEGVFPDALVRECKRLRDRASSEPWEEVSKRLERDLGCSLAEVFAEIDHSPIAAASIAQVHAATLLDGTEVVVKLRRGGIEEVVERDVRALAWLAPLLVGRLPWASLANPPALVELFAETIIEELDFRVEAVSMLDVARALAKHGRDGVVVPRPHGDLVRSGVLVQERVRGMKLEDGESRAFGLKVVQSLLGCILEGALVEGVFHGDLHTGNMFVLPSGEVALLDFGITARLSPSERLAFSKLVIGGMSGDWRVQLRALAELGALPLDADVEVLGRELGLDRELDVAALSVEELAGELQRLSRALLGSGAKLPKPLMLWGKNVLFVDAAIGEVAPECDVLAVLGEVAARFAMQHGARLMQETGEELVVDERAIRVSLGLSGDVQSMTWRELQARRELIAKRSRGVVKRRHRTGTKG